MTVIIDYGMGNLGSIQNMLKKCGFESIITSDKTIIENAQRLILPGVGAFDTGMKKLKDLNLIQPLNEIVLNKKVPILGICLGIQLMTQSSEEGLELGLNWFDSETVKFNLKNNNLKLPLPNMGWRHVEILKNIALFENLPKDSWYYFVHNYHIVSKCKTDIAITSEYGYEFVASLAKDNIMGVQFHPEKSHSFGLRLLSNFVNYY
jgi:glutamine amidotransferase